MSRRAREVSSSGVYHVVLRGINRQVIFEDEEDYEKFLQILQSCKEISRFRALRQFHAEYIQTAYMDIDQGVRPSDEDVKALLQELCGTDQAVRIQALPVSQRDSAIAALKEQGTSLRQIARLTGWSFGVVRS